MMRAYLLATLAGFILLGVGYIIGLAAMATFAGVLP